MNRREALRTLAAGSAAGALAGGVAAMAIPSAAADTMTPIERMALDLRARYDLDTSNLSDAEGNASADAFHALLDQITHAEPLTPRDVAIQWHADCLFNTSDNSDEFRERLIALSGISEGVTPKPDHMADAVRDYEAAYAHQTKLIEAQDWAADTKHSTETMIPARVRIQSGPAVTSLAGVAAALRYVTSDTDWVDEDHATILRAALSYLEGGAA